MEIVFAKDKKQKKNVFKEFTQKVITKIKGFRPSNLFYYFLVLMGISLGFYMIMLIDNGFTLAYGGDYSAQYIPMGYHVWDYYHEWFKTGYFTLFDESLYLGANSFGSNAYYGLFSPFNIIIVLFPRAAVPYMMAITSMIKLSCAGLFFSIYVKKAFKIKDSISYISGIAYAFAGWGAFYLWYNNYQDILVFFPLVLLGIEKTIQEKKPWVLAIGVFFLAICNYVLMVSYLVCAFLYAMFRFFQTITKRSVTDNFIVLGLGFVGFMGGLLMSMFVFGPALMATLSSPKLDTNSYGKLLKEYLSRKDFKSFFELIFSWAKVDDQHRRIISERALYPIIEFFVPPVTCRSLPTLEIKNWDFDDMAVSLWCYIPMIMFLVPALIQSGKEKKWSHYIGFALVVLMLFTPFMYFATMGFTNGYARWTLFIPAVLIPYVSIYLDKIPNVSKWHIHLGFAFAVLGIVAAWLLTYFINGKKLLQFNTYNGKYEPGSEFIFRFTEDGKNYTNAAFIIELIYVLGVYLTFFFLYNKKKAFTIIATVFVSAEAVAVGNFVTIGHGYDQSYNNGYAMNNRFKSLLNKIKKTDKSFFRMYASIGDGVSTNNGLMNGYGTGSFFHSLYNFEVNDFTRWTFMRNSDKSVGGTYRGKWQDLDNLLGVKYYVISKEKSRYSTINYYYPDGYKANVPYEFEENKDLETSEYKVYVNNKQNGFGYAYDNVYHGKLNVGGYSIEAVKNSISLDTTAVVEDDAAEEIKNKYSSINLSETKPEVAMSYLYMNNHYRHNVYQIHKEDAKNEWDEWAKNLEFEKIATIPDHPESFEKITNYKQDDTMKYFAFYTAKTAGEPLFKAGTTLYAYAPYGSDQRYNFFFIGKDDNGEYKVFMTDDHDDENTDNTSYMRGFYITKDVYRIAVMGKWRYSNLRDSDIRLYTEYQENYENRVEALRANPITDISYSKDTFKFRTNYTSNKFVVSQIAFDAGWKIKAVNNQTKEKTNIKVYKGNGGFVSFIAPVGDYSYTMSYETPYLAVSYLVSTVSFIGFFTSMLAYQMYQEKKRNHYLDELYREN